MARFGQKLLCLLWIVYRFRRLPVKLETFRDDAVGQPRLAKRQRLVDPGRSIARLAACRTRRSCHGDFGSHWSAKYSHCAPGHRRFERQPRGTQHLLGEFAADRVGDVDLAALQRREAGRLVRDRAEDEALDARRFAPIPLERLHHQFDARGERDKFVRPRPDRVLLETVVADLLDIFLRHDPARTAGARIKGQKVRPRFLQLEADMPFVRDLHRRDPLFQQSVGGALVALERELDVLGGHRIAVMELGPRPDHEIIGEAVLRRRRTTRPGSASPYCPASVSPCRHAARTAP